MWQRRRLGLRERREILLRAATECREAFQRGQVGPVARRLAECAVHPATHAAVEGEERERHLGVERASVRRVKRPWRPRFPGVQRAPSIY